MRKGSIYKSELADEYGMSLRQLSFLLNVKYFDRLSLLGYSKNMKQLSPKMVAEFVSIWGTPDEFENVAE